MDACLSMWLPTTARAGGHGGWAQALPLGAWFTIEHNGASARVQYVWHSQRKQLHLFAALVAAAICCSSSPGWLYAGRAAAGPGRRKIDPRATRDALIRLDANPERLSQ